MSKLEESLGQLAGAASLCWNPKPEGVFDPEQAQKFVLQSKKEIKALFLELIGEDEDARALAMGYIESDGRLDLNHERSSFIAELRAKINAL